MQTEKSCASDILHQQMNALNTGETQHTSTWPVILWTLRDITTINFSLNIHGIYTYEHTTYNSVLNRFIFIWNENQTQQSVNCHSVYILMTY